MATRSYHSYYHLLSGVDYPLKSQDYIHLFFKNITEANLYSLIKMLLNLDIFIIEFVIIFFQDIIGRSKGKWLGLCYKIQSILLFLQKQIHVNRLKKYTFSFYKGAQWFSITHNLAEYLLQHKKEIRRIFRWSFCTDEIFLQHLPCNHHIKPIS